MSLKRWLYTLFLYFIFPLVLLRLLWRSRLNPNYRKRWAERLGFVPQSFKLSKEAKPIIWLHAVSVGEAIAAKPLIHALLDEFPNNSILVTSTTPTGSDRVCEMFVEQIESQRLFHVYFPYDLLGSISRFIKAFKPKLLIVVETEIWPNLYASCHKQNIPVMMVNARLSDRSMTSYLKIKNLVAETFSKVSLIAVRSKSDTVRFTQLGAKSEQIEEIGNIKYDIRIDDAQLKSANKYNPIIKTDDVKQRLVFVAASTHEGEDTKILFIYKNLLKQFPDLLLVLVPRHPERFDQVFLDCKEQLSKELHITRHSEFRSFTNTKQQTVDVILGDSMGEMQMWYALSNIVFIGGSLVKTGGHNPLEATVFGVPVFSGPYMFNFEDIASDLSAAELLFICNDEFEISKSMSEYLNDLIQTKNTKLLDQQGYKNHSFEEKTDKFMQQHRGVTTRLINHISSLIKSSD